MFQYDYAIDTEVIDYTVVTVKSQDKTTCIKFEGRQHQQRAMEFVAQFLMVQMGQIGI